MTNPYTTSQAQAILADKTRRIASAIQALSGAQWETESQARDAIEAALSVLSNGDDSQAKAIVLRRMREDRRSGRLS